MHPGHSSATTGGLLARAMRKRPSAACRGGQTDARRRLPRSVAGCRSCAGTARHASVGAGCLAGCQCRHIRTGDAAAVRTRPPSRSRGAEPGGTPHATPNQAQETRAGRPAGGDPPGTEYSPLGRKGAPRPQRRPLRSTYAIPVPPAQPPDGTHRPRSTPSPTRLRRRPIKARPSFTPAAAAGQGAFADAARASSSRSRRRCSSSD
jgi:hypothetical protein